MRWNNTLLAIWLKWRSANLFLNMCFVKFWLNPKDVPIWFRQREIIFMIFSRSYAVKQYAAGYLIEVEVSKFVSQHLFCKILNECKSCSYLIQVDGNDFLFFLVLMRWNNTLLAIWLKWRSANLFLNICFVKFWMNPKVDPIWFKWREMTFYFFSFLCGETKRCWLSDWSGGQQTCFLTSVL